MNRFILIILFCIISIQNELPANSFIREDTQYYWFYIKLSKVFDKETGTNRLYLKKIGDEIESGSVNEFLNTHKQGLKEGKIVLGPFPEIFQAQQSQSLYKKAGNGYRISERELANMDDSTLYSFYYIQPMSEDYQQDINFLRIPSRISYGTLNEFVELLNEGLSYEKLAIGPFYDYELAERSKFVSRKNGELNSEAGIDVVKTNELQNMAKKWKSLALKMIKQYDDRKLKKTIFQFRVKFPNKYFVVDAFQTIIIRAQYGESAAISTAAFTLQGYDVVDNNPVISFDLGTLYVNPLSFDLRNKEKITGFLFESFIYNNSEIVELDPIFIAVK